MDSTEDKPSIPVTTDNENKETKDDTIDNNKKNEVENKKLEEDSSKNVDKKDDNKSETDNKKEDSLSHRSSNSSISSPKSILRKRRTGGEDEEGSIESIDDSSSTSSAKRKHIEFSDDNIVYTLKQEDDYDDEDNEEDDEAYKGHSPEYGNESVIYTIFVLIKRYLLFAIVIAAGFCFSYYSYNSNNKKSRSSGRHHSGVIQDQGPPINWNNKVDQTKDMKKTSIRIDSITMSEILSSSKTTSVFQPEKTPAKVVPGEQQQQQQPKEEKSESSSGKEKEQKEKKIESGFKRVVAVGDIHGDYEKLLKVLTTAKIIDKKGNWIAKDTALVQTGDLIDRGSDTILIFDLMIKLKEQAKKNGCVVYMLLGNHEVMNLQEDFRYVTRGDVMSFGGMEKRRKEFSIEGKYGKLLRTEMNATMIVDDTLFVHAGLISNFAKFGVEQMNNHVHHVLQNYPPEQLFYAPLFTNNGPFWTRFMALGQEAPMCSELDIVLEMLNVKRMVVGHTVQENGKINTRCNKKFYMIDVGMSAFYGGGFAFLEILNDKNEVWAVYSENKREKIN